MTRFASATPGARAGLIVAALVIGLALVAVGALAVALAGLGRLSPEVEPARVPIWFWYYRHDPAVARWLAVGVSTSGLTALVIAAAALLTRRRPLYGAARWASASEQRRAGLRAEAGVILGRADGGFLIADGPEHVMLYAPTRTGKGVGVVIPNLLAWPGSVVVLDIKRENFTATAGYRAECGQDVHLFDPLALDGRTSRFNPLGHVPRDDPVAVLDELQRMAAMLFPAHPRADPFWAEAARSGFIGVGGLVAATSELPFTLGEIHRQLTAGDARTRLPRLIADAAAEGRPLTGPVASALRDFTEASDNTFASVRQSITSRMGLWLNPRVDAATAASDFDLAAIRSGRLSLYLGATPDNLLRVQPLYALLFQQLIDRNCRALPEQGVPPTLLVLDEFARLGAAPVLANAFAWIAGYGLRILAVVQSPAQLRALHGQDVTEDILANCGVEVVFAPKELGVARDLSERLGYTTVRASSRSRPAGLGAGRRSVSTSDQRRALMLPQELMRLSPRRLIVLKVGVPPTLGRKIIYWRERVFRKRSRPPPEAPLAAAPSPVGSPPLESLRQTDDSLSASTGTDVRHDPQVAPDPDMGVWLDRMLDASAREPDS